MVSDRRETARNRGSAWAGPLLRLTMSCLPFQVAEMHGELIEFNERLHRALVAKEALVSQMRQELIDLRGPVSAPHQQAGLSPASSLGLPSVCVHQASATHRNELFPSCWCHDLGRYRNWVSTHPCCTVQTVLLESHAVVCAVIEARSVLLPQCCAPDLEPSPACLCSAAWTELHSQETGLGLCS